MCASVCMCACGITCVSMRAITCRSHDLCPLTSGSNFLDLQRGFMEEHYHSFEDKEENQLIYTDIFQRYVREAV